MSDITVSVTGGSGVTVDVTGSTAAADVAVSGATASVSVTQMGGDRGPQGDPGPANTLAIGTVTTGAAGSNASATITGTAPNQTLSLTIPRGDVGQTGSTGATGAVGPAGPPNSLAIGTVTTGEAGSSASATITGTAPSQTLSLTLPRGEAGPAGSTGATGPAGPANSLGIGTVTTGAAGSSASATISGTAPNQTLSLSIPRGDTGATGSTGPAGPANSLAIGTVTTGAAGSSASATITGTAPSQTLNLVIPRGDAGTGGLSWASTPSTPGDPGTAGAMAYDANNIYVCVATNSWKRAALSTWTVSDPFFASVSLLLHMNGANGSTTFTDSSPSPKTVTASGGATISTAQSKFGGASGLFNGSDSSLTVPSDATFNFSDGDFTVEAWIYRSSSGVNQLLVTANGTGVLCFGFDNIDRLGVGRIISNTLIWDNAATHGITLNTWAHVAVSRSSSSLRFFVNGSQVGGTFSNAVFYNLSSGVSIGGQVSGWYYSGYIDDLRITKGVARYTANFTPPTAPFPDT